MTRAISTQHYLFSVQAFAQAVLAQGGTQYAYAYRDRTTKSAIEDVACGESELAVLLQTSENAAALNTYLDERGLVFTQLVESHPQVALPKSHPLVHAQSLTLDDLADYPYICFEQEDEDPAFREEALSRIERARSIACRDRASLSELICALNGYTVTSGILVGISDGSLLATVPLETDMKLRLGIVTKKNADLSEFAQTFVDSLTRQLERYARL